MLYQLWHWILGLPHAAYAYVAGLVVAGVVAAKHKTIMAAVKKLNEFATRRFWGWVSKNVAPAPRTNDRTYKGVFQGFFQYSSYPHEWYFDLLENGVVTKVPCLKSNLLSGVPRGVSVEIDTQVLPGAKVEMIRRVRVKAP